MKFIFVMMMVFVVKKYELDLFILFYSEIENKIIIF
jgi:hypothetical protein